MWAQMVDGHVRSANRLPARAKEEGHARSFQPRICRVTRLRSVERLCRVVESRYGRSGAPVQLVRAIRFSEQIIGIRTISRGAEVRTTFLRGPNS